MKVFFEKHREIISYIFFGAITTAVSMGVYFAILLLAEHVWELDPGENAFYTVRVIAQIAQWVAGVLVAFFTNKKWVFESRSTERGQTVKELLSFTASRVGTFALDSALTIGTVWLLMTLGYTPFTFIIEVTADVWSKVVASVVVIIANYLLSKYLVFRKAK